MSVLVCVFVCIFGYASSERVIIIGAGASGIAAASRLLENNITDFIILEAENRIGGRINSFQLGEAIVDLGAQYVHGEKDNIVYSIAKDYVVHKKQNETTAVYFSGRRIIGENLQNISHQLYLEIGKQEHSKDLSLGEAYLSSYNATIISKYMNDPQMLSYAKCLLKNIEGAILSSEGAFDWYKVSASTDYIDSAGDQTLSWNGLGYKTILDILLKNFPNKTGYSIDDKIILEKTVTKVSLNKNSVEVRCKDGSKYSGDHVLFTPSLGVLKHNHREIFDPELSTEKVEAIENIGFDGIMKVLVEFTESWRKNGENFLFVWNEKDIEDLKKHIPYGPRTNDDHWLTWFSFIGMAPRNPLVMIGWYSGPFVEEVEKLTQEQMEKAVFYALQKHLGRDYNITKPKTVIHSKWCANPNFRGTYSYETVQLRTKNITSPQVALAEPVKGQDGIPRVFFAGEATNHKRFSTVDGAIGSGFREGDRLVEILK